MPSRHSKHPNTVEKYAPNNGRENLFSPGPSTKRGQSVMQAVGGGNLIGHH